MSTPHPADRLDPSRPLKRARPILAGNGYQQDALVNNDRGGVPGPSPNGFSTTFRRTFRDFKDRSTTVLGRSRSLSAQKTSNHSGGPGEARRPGHSRSLTDVSTVSSMVALQAGAAPARASRVSSTPPHRPTLAIVSEGVASQHNTTSNDTIADPPSPILSDIKTLQILRSGTLLTKVSAKKQKVCLFRLEADLGQIVWVSKVQKIIPIESIKEIRSGKDARYTREHLQLAEEYQDRWLTIIYMLDGNYKTLHLIAPDQETFRMWDETLRALHSIRQGLMRGLGNGEMRQALWEKQYWKAADEEPDHKLSFTEVENLCKKLNFNTNREDLLRLFKQADNLKRGYLDFDDFRRFVKLLKARPEIDRIYKRLRADNDGTFNYVAFEKFMKEKQKSSMDKDALRALFAKYSTSETTIDTSTNETHKHAGGLKASVMTVEAFTSFLSSPDNTASVDQHSDVSQVMTHPLPEYFISSSHNTYLVGHQLVGASSTEGYIRALLHGCRSVEVDIYDGELEPMVFHGKTLTSKVSLREVCKAIMKYGFSSSPYPIIISAEVHCSVPQQDFIAAIMIEEFGDALVRMPPEGLGKIKVLPSPEALKGKILLKAKNKNLVRLDSASDIDPFFSEMSASASDSDAFFEMEREQPPKALSTTSLELKIKEQLTKAGSTFMRRMKGKGKKPSPKLKDAVISQSPPPMTAFEEAQMPSTRSLISPPPPPARAGFLQRARRSLRGSSSSASDGPSTHSEVSTSSADVYPSETPQPLTLLQRIRMGKPHSLLETSPPQSSPMPIGFSGITLQHSRLAKQRSAPTPETVFAQSPPPLSALSISCPPPSATLKPAGLAAVASAISDTEGRSKLKMSPHLLSLLVYTVGVKCRGINKKEEYAPEHMFSLSEKTANKMLRFGMWDLTKHTKNHLVRTYPKGTRVTSTNYAPHRFWAAGMQLVALNWQTFDLGYMINYAMFQRNGRSGYVLKPDAIRLAQKDLLAKRTKHIFGVKVISGQQLPRPKDASGREIGERQIVDPYVEVTLFVPDWPIVSDSKKEKEKEKLGKADDVTPNGQTLLPGAAANNATSTPSYAVIKRTSTVKKNGFNPVWEEDLSLPFDCAGDMMDLVFVRFMVKQEVKDADELLAMYCASLGSLQQGYRHLPLHDSQMSQYLFSTLFVRINISLDSTAS